MNAPDIQSQTYQFFLEEAPELLQIIETNLLNLDPEGNPALIHDLMRAAHSIKGGAATVGLDSLATIAHRLESIFRGLHCESVAIAPELEMELLQAYDCLRKPLELQITQGNFDEKSALEFAETVLSKIEHRLGSAIQEAENYLPSSADLGVDIVSSIFSVDVSQGINRLMMVLASPEDYEVGGELRAQAEVFAGFAEILNLPGFGAIAQTTIAALDACPDKVLEILAQSLVDWQAAREAVLGGDHAQGGTPSAELRAFAEESLIQVEHLDIPKVARFEEVTLDLDTVDNCLSEIEAIAIAEVPPEAEIATIDANSREIDLSPQPQLNRATSASNQGLKVKVDLNRLERMNNLIGELTINRNSLTFQQEQLRDIVNKIQDKLANFQHFISIFPEESTQNTLKPEIYSLNLRQSLPSEILDSDRSISLDNLELDLQQHSSLEEMQEELVQLEEAVEDLTLFSRQSDRTVKNQQQILTKLRDELMWARMLPLEKVLSCFPRSLRDLSLKYHKPVDLEMNGTEILVDKGILEKLHNPLLHLVRNAFDHGIETPEIRRSQGKPAQGKIEIHAAHQGNRTLIEISDDGGGLDLNKIARRAMERGWISGEQLSKISEAQLLDFIFEPGFSTAPQVSELSGRGVGLDVVRSQLAAVKGNVTVTSTPGGGTTFTLSLPLTLTIAKLLVCSVQSTLVAIPVASIQEIILPQSDRVKQIGIQKVISWREQLLPVYQLAELLDYRYPISVNRQHKNFVGNGLAKSGASSMLIIHDEQQNFALEIEDFGTEQEMVIKPLTGAINPPNYVYGCTVLGDGSLIPAINAAALLTYVQSQQVDANISTPNNNRRNSTTIQIPTVLVVDDSATIRRTLTLTLQKAGYRVLQAHSGIEALELLEQCDHIELIVSDLEMPNLNGFEFLNRRRQNLQLSQIPVIMLTTRSNNKHRQLAMHLGASAYLSKPYIEQEFLSVLKTIIGKEKNIPIPALPFAA